MIDFTKGPVELPEDLGWNLLALQLCQMLEIPDLRKRSDFKMVHKNFDVVQYRLAAMFDAQPGEEGEDMVQGGIAVIWGKLCSDGILREKLIGAGIIAKIIPLLRNKRVRFIVLRSLASMSHVANFQTRIEIGRTVTPSLLEVLNEERGNEWIIDMCASILSHGLTALLAGVTEPIKRTSDFPWARVLDAMLDLAAEYPYPSDDIFDHAVQFLVSAPQALRHFYLSNPRAIEFLCALVHAEAMELRVRGMQGLLRLQISIAVNKFDRYIPQEKLMKKDWPDHILDVFWAYGFERCDIPIALTCEMEYQNAMFDAATDLDLVSLGKKIYSIAMRSEMGIGKGTFLDKQTNKAIQTRLPFLHWEDGLAHCAAALKALGPGTIFTVGDLKVSAVDMADVLTIKSHMLHSRYDLANDVALAGVVRCPDELYYYYAIGVAKGGNAEEKLKFSRKGLTRARIPVTKDVFGKPTVENYLRRGLLMNSAEHALFLGVDNAENALHGTASWGRVVALFKIALDDSRAYLKDAAPDNRHYGRVLMSDLIATLVWEGNTLGPDLGKIQKKLDRLKLVDEIARSVYAPPEPTQFRLAFETFMEHNTAACTTWKTLILRLQDPANPSPTKIPAPEEDKDLIEWLDAETCKHHAAHAASEKPTKTLVNKWGDEALALYCCTSCGNPSAVLRKCSRCAKARYCDQACQKKDWADGHKKICKA